MLLVGCVDEEPAFETLDQEVLGEVIVQRDDGIPGGVATCTTADVSEANLVRFRSALLTDLMPKARAVARSGAFESCIRSAITQGSSMWVRRLNFPPYGQLQQFGPLDLTGSDLGVVTTQHMPVERRRDLYATRMLSDAASPHGMTITCMQNPGGLALQVPNPHLDRARSDPFYVSKDFFNHDPSHAGFRAFTMAVIWHEMMHERGYHHPDAAVATLDEYNNTLPPIVGACMEQVFAESEQYCGLEACAGGTRMVNAINGDWGSCICEPENPAPVLVDSWDWPGLIKVAVNGAGDGYALAWNGTQQTAYARAGHAWTSLGTASALVAGADAVAYRHAFDVTALGAGDDFFARSINGWVYRHSPPHGWQQVAQCDNFAVGGRSMYCVRGTRLELYEY